MSFVDAVRAAPAVRRLQATEATWRQLSQFVERDSFVVGNLVPDAWIAALAVSAGARVATADAGFARFQGLTWFNPAHTA